MNLTITHSTFVIERSLRATPERVFAALSQPEKKKVWYTAGRAIGLEEFAMDCRPGGHDRALFRFTAESPFPGTLLLYETTYLDVVPNQRIVYAYAMSIGGRCVSGSLVTFELAPAEGGTELTFTEQGAYFEGADGEAMREAGWNRLLDSLAEAVAR